MAVIHISEAEAARDFAGLLAQLRPGAQIHIERDHEVVAVMHAPAIEPLTMAERIARMPDSPAVDADFARDVASARRREPLRRAEWE